MRKTAVALSAGIVALVLSACGTQPPDPLPIPTQTLTPPETQTPSPTTTPGEDPEADVAAAIATYEAYVDAGNQLVLADPTTWEPVYALLQDPYLSSSKVELEQMANDGFVMSGSADVVSAEVDDQAPTLIRLHVCTDFEDRRIIDTSGNNHAADGVRSLNVLLAAQPDTSTPWLIAHIGQSEATCTP